MKTNQNAPNGYKPELAETARMARKTRGGYPTIVTGRNEGGSSRLQLLGKSKIRFIQFEGRVRTVDEEVQWTDLELQTAFDNGKLRINDPGFASRENSDYGITDRFVRTEEKLVVLVKNKKGFLHEMSICISPAIGRAVDLNG